MAAFPRRRPCTSQLCRLEGTWKSTGGSHQVVLARSLRKPGVTKQLLLLIPAAMACAKPVPRSNGARGEPAFFATLMQPLSTREAGSQRVAATAPIGVLGRIVRPVIGQGLLAVNSRCNQLALTRPFRRPWVEGG